MSEQRVFMIANLKINDKNAYQIYEKGFFPILKKYGGEFVTYDDSVETFEGSTPLEGRTVIFSFPSPEKAKEWLADTGYDPVYGARPLKRVIQRKLQNPLAEKILKGDIMDGNNVKVDVSDLGLYFEMDRKKVA